MIAPKTWSNRTFLNSYSNQPPIHGEETAWKYSTPCKINMEPKNEGLENEFLFQVGDA